MNLRRTGGALVAVALLAVIGYIFWPRANGPATPPGEAIVSALADGRPAATTPAAPGISALAPTAEGERSELAKDLNSPRQDIRADLRVLEDVFDAFRSNFPHTGNPTGNNAEITAALTGNNPLHLALIPPDHPAINARGELCDRWGNPFFFHQLSGTQMEIRSAGPDKKFWTGDDVVLTP